MLMALLKLAQQGRGIINDIISIRNYQGSGNTRTYWSPKYCENCDLCTQRGPRPLCPFCNIDLIGTVNYVKIIAKLTIDLPLGIMKGLLWAKIKYLITSTING